MQYKITEYQCSKKVGKVRKKREYHGMKDTPLYLIWAAMVNRTTNPKNYRYKYYGGRGIKVCNKWKNSVEEFCYWALSNGYDNGYAIIRKDVNGDLELQEFTNSNKYVLEVNDSGKYTFVIKWERLKERRGVYEWHKYYYFMYDHRLYVRVNWSGRI